MVPLHRIQKAELLEKGVVVPDGFDLDTHISKELSFPVGEDIRLTARFSDHDDIQRLEETPVSVSHHFSSGIAFKTGKRVYSAIVNLNFKKIL